MLYPFKRALWGAKLIACFCVLGVSALGVLVVIGWEIVTQKATDWINEMGKELDGD